MAGRAGPPGRPGQLRSSFDMRGGAVIIEPSKDDQYHAPPPPPHGPSRVRMQYNKMIGLAIDLIHHS